MKSMGIQECIDILTEMGYEVRGLGNDEILQMVEHILDEGDYDDEHVVEWSDFL